MMFRNLSIFNAIVIAVAIFALLVPPSEARLGSGAKLTPSTPEPISGANPDTTDSNECNVPCQSGSRSTIAICHRRGNDMIDICTDAGAFAEHYQMGDTCGSCGTI